MRLRRLAACATVPVLLAAACGQATDPPGDLAPGPRSAGAVASGWERLPDGPLSGRVGAVVVGLGRDEVLVVGGAPRLCPPTADCAIPDTPLRADGAVLDTGTGAWRPIADAPYGLAWPRSVTVGTGVHLLTSCRPGPGCDGPIEHLHYDIRADRWDRMAGPPAGVGVGHLVRVDAGFVVVSGTDENGETRDALYDNATDSWRVLADDPLPQTFDRVGVVDGDRLLVFGSLMDGDGKVAAALDLATREWTRLPDAPGHGYQVWRAGDEAWLNPHFGTDGGGVLDLATDTWRPFPTPPKDPEWRGDMAGIIGPDGAAYEYAHGWVRDARADRWVEVPERPGTTFDETVAAAGHDLVVFGGQDWGDEDWGDGDHPAEGELVAETWVWRPPHPDLGA